VHGPFDVPQVDPGMVAVAGRTCPAMTFVVVLQ